MKTRSDYWQTTAFLAAVHRGKATFTDADRAHLRSLAWTDEQIDAGLQGRTRTHYTFIDLDAFCEVMRRAGGTSNVLVTLGIVGREERMPGTGGRYISFGMPGSEQKGIVPLGAGSTIVFLCILHGRNDVVSGTAHVTGGPFPFTADTLRAVADAGVAPKDFGPRGDPLAVECEARVAQAMARERPHRTLVEALRPTNVEVEQLIEAIDDDHLDVSLRPELERRLAGLRALFDGTGFTRSYVA